ncbi:lasso peptide biosynthesis B2 protein [Actinacidiphila glaucinigra]|uniref:lasso peptide biosynthesis B2 protein n=1 Tax=Actinacidiphila glaucinigra TaxID=235986 RepID=UPI00368E24C8
MSARVPHKVAVAFPACTVVVNYRDGRTRLYASLGPGFGDDVLVVHHQDDIPSWGTVDVPAALESVPHAPLRWRLGAVPALAVTAAVAALGARQARFRRMVALATLGRRLRPADKERATDAVRAVRWASRVIPARWACLEQSTAAALLLAATGHRAEWRHGVSTDPVRLHAWVADPHGRPVEEPEDTSLYAVTYTPNGPGPQRSGA